MRKLGQASSLGGALLSGLLSGAAFAPLGWTVGTILAPVPLLWALDRDRDRGARRAFLLAWLAAWVHFVFVLHWILFLPSEEVTIPGIMIPSLLFMAAYLGVYFGAGAVLASWITRRLRLPLGLAWAVCVTLADAARSQGELAFPWGSPAYAFSGWTPWLQMTSVTGFWGLVLWVALCGGLFYHALRGATPGRRVLVGAIGVALFLGPYAHGRAVLAHAPAGAVDGAAGIKVSLIQPNTSRDIKWDPDFRDLVVGDLLERTRKAAASRPDLIVWPETAAPIVLLAEPVYLARVQQTVAETGVPLLAGTLDHRIENGGYVAHNSAALFDSTGRLVDRYDKRRLVPFSERMPFQRALPWLAGLNFGQSDFSPGTRTVLFQVRDARVGCLICFESIFPELSRQFVAEGANVLANITNDFWFGNTAAPVQHADMAIFRAVETRRPLLRCANTGISFVVDPFGRVTHRTRTFTEARIDTRVAPARETTFYVRHGEWILRGLLALAGASVMAGLAAPRRRNG
jgi:apolipoprotein N-acyltransferase